MAGASVLCAQGGCAVPCVLGDFRQSRRRGKRKLPKKDQPRSPTPERQLASWGRVAYNCLNSRGPSTWKDEKRWERRNRASEEDARGETSGSAGYLQASVAQWAPTLTHSDRDWSCHAHRQGCPQAGSHPWDSVPLETAGNVWRRARDAAEHFTVPRFALPSKGSSVPSSHWCRDGETDLPANLSAE